VVGAPATPRWRWCPNCSGLGPETEPNPDRFAPRTTADACARAHSFPSMMLFTPRSATSASGRSPDDPGLRPHPLRQPRIAHHQRVGVELELGREVAVELREAHDAGPDVLVALG
jgi:hypothetical protein